MNENSRRKIVSYNIIRFCIFLVTALIITGYHNGFRFNDTFTPHNYEINNIKIVGVYVGDDSINIINASLSEKDNDVVKEILGDKTYKNRLFCNVSSPVYQLSYNEVTDVLNVGKSGDISFYRLSGKSDKYVNYSYKLSNDEFEKLKEMLTRYH